jgi:hypothetical protein
MRTSKTGNVADIKSGVATPFYNGGKRLHGESLCPLEIAVKFNTEFHVTLNEPQASGASRHLQLGHFSNRRNVPSRQVCVQIAQVFLKILQGFALGHVIRILFQVTKPELAILPVNIPQTFHGLKIQRYPSSGNGICVSASTQTRKRERWPPRSVRRLPSPERHCGGGSSSEQEGVGRDVSMDSGAWATNFVAHAPRG